MAQTKRKSAKSAAGEKGSREKRPREKKVSVATLLTSLKDAQKLLNDTSLNPIAALRQIEINSPMVVICGDDLRLRRIVEWFRENLFPSKRGCAVSVFHGNELNSSAQLDSISASLRSLSLFSSTELFVIKEPDELRAQGAKVLAERIAAPSDSAFVLIVARQVNSKSSLINALPPTSSIYEISDLGEDEVRNWIEKEAQRIGMPSGITPDAAKLLMTCFGTNLLRISQELAKIALSAGPGDKIGREFVEKLILGSPEHSNFELLTVIAKRNPLLSERLLQNILSNGSHPLQISYFLSRAYRSLLLRHSGEQLQGLHADLTNPWFWRNISGVQNLFSEHELRDGIEVLRKLDQDLKSSGFEDNLTASVAIKRLALRERLALAA